MVFIGIHQLLMEIQQRIEIIRNVDLILQLFRNLFELQRQKRLVDQVWTALFDLNRGIQFKFNVVTKNKAVGMYPWI